MHQRRLGSLIGRASIDELDDIIESLARRFTGTHRPSEVATADGIMPIDAGSLWRPPVIGSGGGTFFATVRVIDYNAGNNLAITVEVEERQPRPESPEDVPINMLDSNIVATALIQRVRTIDVGERDLAAVGGTRPESVGAVISRFLSMIQPAQA